MPDNKVQLKSNFKDFYDFAFDREGMVFERLDNGGMTRREMLAFLEELGLKTPEHGIVEAVAAKTAGDLGSDDPDFGSMLLEHCVDLVVYLDETQHAGEGKIKVSAQEALAKYPGRYCSVYVPATMTGFGESLRYLQVGDRKWWIRYWSDTDWRSNAGEGDYEVLGEEKIGYHPRIDAPMFAIDFVKAANKLYAIDYNIAPGLAPLNGIVAPWDIVELIKKSMARNLD